MTDTYTPEKLNGTAAPESPRVEFGTGKSQSVPHEWARWMLTTMRDDELKGVKPRSFSVLLGACALEMKS